MQCKLVHYISNLSTLLHKGSIFSLFSLSAPPNNLFVKVYTGTSITNDQMTVIQQLAKDAV